MEVFCRTCLQQIRNNDVLLDVENDYKLLDTIKYKLVMCVPEMDLSIIPGAKICKDCYTSLINVYNFKIQCHKSEEIIVKCFKKYGIIDFKRLSDLSKTINNDENDSSSLSDVTDDLKLEDLMIKEEKVTLDEGIINVSGKEDNCVIVDVDGEKAETIVVEETVKNQRRKPANSVLHKLHSKKSKGACSRPNTSCLSQLQCSKCDFKSNYKIAYINHSLSHTAEKKYSCPKCEYRSSSKRDLQNHIGKHPKVMLECSLCEYKTRRKLDLKRHVQSHAKVKSCINVKLALKERVLSRKLASKYQCLTCDYKSSNKADLKRHGHLHAKNNLDFKSSLNYTIDNSRTIKDKFHENVCQSKKEMPSNDKTLTECSAKSSLKRKRRKLHCLSCSHKTKQLPVEMKASTLEKTLEVFRCNMCTYTTDDENVLTSHCLLHQTEETSIKTDNQNLHTKPPKYLRNAFQCSSSSYKTKYELTLSRHSLSHQTKQPTRNNICNGVKLFTCPKCNYETRRKTALERHLANHSSAQLKTNDDQYISWNSDSGRSIRNPDWMEYTNKELVVNVDRMDLSKCQTANGFHCSLCKYKSNDESDLKTHTRTSVVLENSNVRSKTATVALSANLDLKQQVIVH